MEYQQYNQVNPFDQFGNQTFSNHFYRYQKCQQVPVEAKLKQNRERRLIIEKEKQKQKENILQKRKQKQDNVQKILKQKQQARDNAKLIFANMQKTFTNKFQDKGLKRSEDIQEKIQECRSRADKYRTMYKKKIHDDRQDRQKSVKQRKIRRQQLENTRSINYHLAQWKQYQKKIVQKYKNQPKSMKIYQKLMKKQEQLKQIIQKHKIEEGQSRLSSANDNSISRFKKIIIKKNRSEKEITQQKENSMSQINSIQKNNPICSVSSISSFGLSKSIKNPQKMLKQMKEFIQQNLMLENPSQDEQLIKKFEQFLRKQNN